MGKCNSRDHGLVHSTNVEPAPCAEQFVIGSGPDKVQGVAPVSFNLFGVNGGIIKRVPPISHWI